MDKGGHNSEVHPSLQGQLVHIDYAIQIILYVILLFDSLFVIPMYLFVIYL